ncbi:MAG: acyl carrier protein [Clostridiales bacterium]|nr:acyl carrier protein [Clostridiales bacterium]
MTNLEKYKEAFINGLELKTTDVENLKYQAVQEWDSVGHMSLITAIEDAFDIMMDTEDIVELNSFEKGKEILSKNYNIEF